MSQTSERIGFLSLTKDKKHLGVHVLVAQSVARYYVWDVEAVRDVLDGKKAWVEVHQWKTTVPEHPLKKPEPPKPANVLEEVLAE